MPQDHDRTTRRRGRPIWNIAKYEARKEEVYNKTYRKIRRAIINQDQEPIKCFGNILDKYYSDTIDYTQRNLKRIEKQYLQRQLSGYFAIGEGLI